MKKTLQALALLFLSLSSFAQITWTNDFGGGNNQWSTDQNWDAVAVPSSADAVIFDGAVSNDDCFIGDFSEALSITFQNGYTGTVEIGGGASLTAYDGFTMPTAATFVVNGDFNTGIFNVTNGTVDASGATTFTVSVDFGGTASTGGAFTISGCAFTAPSTTNLIITGTINNRTAGTFNANGGTVTFIPRISKNIGSGYTGTNGFNNLSIENNGSGALSSTINAGGVTVKGTLSIVTSGSKVFLLNTGTISVLGDLDVSNSLGVGSSAANGAGGTATIQLTGTTAQSIIGNASNAAGGNLPNVTIAQGSGGSVTLSGRINFARNLTINSNSTITPGTSTVAFQNTNQTSTLSGTTTTNPAFYGLLLNKSGSSLSISSLTASWVTLSNLLTVTAGTLNTGGKLALLSTATNSSAMVGPVGGTISGNVRVERFINGATGRKWRFLASPVTTSNFISANWQQSIHITGAGTGGTICPTLTAHTNTGFDATVGNSPSMYTYNEGSAAWASIPSTNGTNLTAGVGYRVFVRGNRSQGCALLDGTNPTPSDVTLSAIGTLATSSQTINPSFGTGSGWNLIGNPYQAPIDWERVTAGNRTNVEDFFQIFDPNGGVGGAGAYVTYNGATNSATGNVNQYIGPGHAFWVKANAGGASITFEEADKEVTVTGTTLFKTGGRNPNDLSIRVVDQNGYFDEVVAAFNDNANLCYDADKDIEKFQFAQGAGNIALYTSCNATRYSINAIPLSDPTVTDTLFLHIKLPAATSANYTLQFTGIATAINSQSEVYLIDKFTNTFHNLRNNSSYAFSTVANNAASQGANRFVVLYGGNLTSLPVKLISFDAVRNGNKGELNWVTATEQNNRSFTVERSSDGKHFNEIGVVKAKGLSSTASKYVFTDGRPVLGGLNFYRLKMTDNNGTVTYSVIRTIDFNEGEITKAELVTSVYPVPAKDRLLLEPNSESGISSISYTIFDLTGKLVSEKQTLTVEDPGSSIEIALPVNLKSGFYFMDLSDGRGGVQRVKFVVE